MLSLRHRRQIEGCYWLGCFTPVAFTLLAGLIVIKAIADKFRT